MAGRCPTIVTLTLGAEATTLPLQPGDRSEGAVMDRFGAFNMQDNNGKDCLFYLDNLRYTTGRPDLRRPRPEKA